MLLVVTNPVCGHRAAPAFFAAHVVPRLADRPHSAVQTNSPGHAGEIVVAHATAPLTVVLGSGDGTLHEILNALHAANVTTPVDFVLVPCGTANALYSSLFPPPAELGVNYKLQSLDAFLQNKSPIHLSLATTVISSESEPVSTSIASVVVSTALHASILHDSEALRERHPGIERFKLAAQQNSNKWYNARLKLTPSSLGFVQVYNPSSKSLIPHSLSTNESPAVEIEGPFAYFLSTVNVDRLEPAFRTTPLARAIPPSAPAFDIVVLRPLRDPTIERDTPETRFSFIPKTWKVLGGAYQDGEHVDFVYTSEGEIASGVHGPSVVEYFRCGGWEWIPDPTDPDAHLVCSDGAISVIPPNGKAGAAVDTFPHHFAVYN